MPGKFLGIVKVCTAAPPLPGVLGARLPPQGGLAAAQGLQLAEFQLLVLGALPGATTALQLPKATGCGYRMGHPSCQQREGKGAFPEACGDTEEGRG